MCKCPEHQEHGLLCEPGGGRPSHPAKEFMTVAPGCNMGMLVAVVGVTAADVGGGVSLTRFLQS